MASLAEIKAQAMDLSESERAVPASHLLQSPPAILEEDREGIEEALARREEMKRNSDFIISLEQLQKSVGR